MVHHWLTDNTTYAYMPIPFFALCKGLLLGYEHTRPRLERCTVYYCVKTAIEGTKKSTCGENHIGWSPTCSGLGKPYSIP